MKIFVSIFLFFFLTSKIPYAQCKDSSFRLKFTFTPDSLQVKNFKKGVNDIFLFSGHLVHTPQLAQLSSMVFGKINNEGKLIWAKYGDRISFPDNSIIYDFEETPNIIYWAGNFSGNSNKPFVIKTDQLGNIIETFYFNINYGTGLPYSYIKEIRYINDDEIYLLVTYTSSGTFAPYNLILRFRNDGSIVWSRVFKTDDRMNTYNGICTDIFKSGNELYIFGGYNKFNDLDNPSNRAGIFKMKLNPVNGDIIQTNSFYIPMLREFELTWYIQEDFKLTVVPNGLSFSTLINGVSTFSGIYKNKAIKINLDSNLDIKKIIQITPISVDLNDRIIDFEVNNNNESCVVINNNYDNYFSILNKNDSLVNVRKLRYAYTKPFEIYKGLVFDNINTINHLAQYAISSSDSYELLRLQGNWPNSNRECMGLDTSYIKTGTINYSASDFTWIETAEGVAQKQILNLSSNNVALADELICKEDMVCNAISLTAPDTICDISQPIIIKAHKNQSCLKKVDFLFDTTAVNSYSQPDDTTLVVSFNKTWTGKIYASPASCTFLVDSIQLSIIKPMPSIDLGEDVTYCPGKNYSLNVGSGYKQYLWQDGSNDSIFIATEPGRYFITATDYCNRVYSDTIIVAETAFSLSVGRDTSICHFEKLQLNATPGFSKYTWTPAYRISNTFSNTVTVFPDITTSYSVSAEKFPGCVLKDTITVTIKDCPNQFFIPNAFSPNRDSKNDIFKPIITGSISNYEFNIYNRWGQLVFKSTDKDNGWNGTLKGLNQSGNVFVWICKFKFSNEGLQTKKGTVVLIR